MDSPRWWLGLTILTAVAQCCFGAQYFGKKIGTFKTYHHGVVGDVYAVDARTIHIRGFNYDGEAPGAHFWAGSSEKPDDTGFIVLNEKGREDVLSPYRNKDITITLPEGKTMNDIKWLSVWCKLFKANFADVFIPANFEYPKPRRLEGIVGVMHNTSSGPIVAVDAQTFMIPSFFLDGQAPDAHFWAGTGPKPTVDGVLVPDENGSDKPLGRYDGQSLVISLPGQLTVFDVDWLSVWCREFSVDFGHVKIPKDLNVPPSLKMLGVSPQSKLNCEVLSDELGFEVRWAKAGDTVVIQLVARIADGDYMSFGLSGNDEHSVMVGSDVVVVSIDQLGDGHAVDYYLDSKAQCSNGRGACPDHKIEPNTNTVRLLNAVQVNGYVMVTYQRPLAAVDRLDKAILDNGPQPIVWAVGPLNSLNEVSYHSKANKDDLFIDFNRSPVWNCPAPVTEAESTPAQSDTQPAPSVPSDVHLTPAERPAPSPQPGPTKRRPERPAAIPSAPEATTAPVGSKKDPDVPAHTDPVADAWYIPPIACGDLDDNVFYAQLGPAGGKKGYSSITGHVGWGIAWYVNGLLIPEITVVRGKTYTFVVEGGNDPEAPARNHPFYITDDPVGGFGAKTPEEREKVNVYAGIHANANGDPEPSAAGRLCEWVQKSTEPAEKYGSFGEYQRVLELSCDKGQADILQWTPDRDTPDLVYYQCYTHRYLGWKIHVVDVCEDPEPDFGSSILHEVNVHPELGTVARSLPNVKAQSGGASISSVVSSKIGFENSAPFPGSADAMEGFHPVTSAAEIPLPERPLVVERVNATFVKDPFMSDKSVPFQAAFQPGEPQFGGFGASDYGQRFKKAPPVYIAKRIVPVAPIVPNLPSRLGSVYQPIRRRKPQEDEMMAAQHPVVFRAPAPQDGIPPPPPQLPTPQRPPNGSFLRRRIPPSQHPISADGKPVSGQPPMAPPQRRRQTINPHSTPAVGPFRGTTPPPIPSNVPKLPQFAPQGGRGKPPHMPQEEPKTPVAPPNGTGANDFTILSNVMSIINHEKESRAPLRLRKARAAEAATAEPEATSEPVAEPEAEPTAEPESKSGDHPVNSPASGGDKMDRIEGVASERKEQSVANGGVLSAGLNVKYVLWGLMAMLCWVL